MRIINAEHLAAAGVCDIDNGFISSGVNSRRERPT